MKNLAKILAMALLVGLFGVVAVQSLLATPSVQTPLVATTSYNVATGIRYNEGLGVFEVFNANGISYIASNHYFNAIGEIVNKDEQSVAPTYIKADGTKTYNIMQDIAYNPADTQNQETAFKAGTRYSITTGAVNGRGFILKNFPVKNGTALFSSNAGSICNINLINPIIEDTTHNIGIICVTNSGIIDSCLVSGNAISTTISIAAIAYSGDGTIRNCVNELDITTSGVFAGGIAGDATGAIIYGCTNLGNVKANITDGFAGGIAAFIVRGDILNNNNYGSITANDAGGILGSCLGTTIKSNKNFGDISGTSTACGIVAGVISTPIGIDKDNFHYGYLSGPEGFKHPTALTPAEPARNEANGIYYDPAADVFMVSNMVGLSYLGSGEHFDYYGEKVAEGALLSASTAKTNTTYIITENIEYAEMQPEENSVPLFTTEPLSLGAGSVVDGGGFTLLNFPIREVGNSGKYTALFSELSGTEIQRIKLVTNSTNIVGNTGVFFYEGTANLKDCNVSGSGQVSTSSDFRIGGFSVSGSGRFDTCTNDISIITKGQYAAGFVANPISDTTFENCINNGSITVSDVDGTASSGGFVGIGSPALTIEFLSCTNTGAIFASSSTSATYAGGIIGSFDGATMSANICENTGAISATSAVTGANEITAVGGIIGSATTNSVINSCTNANTGTITGSGGSVYGAWAGGLAGRLTSSTTENNISIGEENLSYVGSVVLFPKNNAVVNIVSSATEQGSYRSGLGGIIGTITGTADTAFTVQGSGEKDTYENSVETGFATANLSGIVLGGIVGFASVELTTNLTIKNCANNTQISSTGSSDKMLVVGGIMGGIVGNYNRVTFEGCLNNGVINAKFDSNLGYLAGCNVVVGGILGHAGLAYSELYATALVVKNCENKNSFDAVAFINIPSYAGGMVGFLVGSANGDSGKDFSFIDPAYEQLAGSVLVGCVNRNRIRLSVQGGNGELASASGGIIGVVYSVNGSNNVSVLECINYGEVVLNWNLSSIASMVGLVLSGVERGIELRIIGCENYGNFSSNAQWGAAIGGFLGQAMASQITIIASANHHGIDVTFTITHESIFGIFAGATWVGAVPINPCTGSTTGATRWVGNDPSTVIPVVEPPV